MRFVVFCLPRSRSAWVANFLSYDGGLCLHEPLLGCRSLDDLDDKMAATGVEFVGCADTAIMAFTEQVIDRYPTARFVALLRQPDGFAAQARKMGCSEQHICDMLERFQEAVEVLSAFGEQTLLVRSKDLGLAHVCDLLWRHVGHTTPMSQARFEMLNDMRVEAMVNRVEQKVRRNKGAITELFGGQSCHSV